MFKKIIDRIINNFCMIKLQDGGLIRPSDIILISIIRNEEARLPYFIKYYRSLGVDKFIIIDNGSTDGSQTYLKQQNDIYLYYTRNFYDQEKWHEFLLKKFGIGHWCIVVDADEYLVFPHSDKINIKYFTSYLSLNKMDAMKFFLLDMYSDKPIIKSGYVIGSNPLRYYQYFDSHSHYYTNNADILEIPITNEVVGGVRKRVFNVTPNLIKTPLIFYKPDMYIFRGQHIIKGQNQYSDMHGTLLHFKFMPDFIIKTIDAVNKKQYWRHSLEYKQYYKILKHNPDLCLKYEYSCKIRSVKTLSKYGFLKTSANYEKFLAYPRTIQKSKKEINIFADL